jgi:hypothetical protein
MTTPFFYIIKHKSGKQYAGVKFAKGCQPSDLLTKYFTSSKVVKTLLQEDSSSFEIIKTIEFESKQLAMEFEEFFLTEIKAHINPNWLNRSAGRAINPNSVKETCLSKYGVDNPSQLQSVKDKVEETCMNRFGFKSRFESEDFANLRKDTMIERYGFEHSMQSPIIQQKCKNTLLIKYGVDNPSKISKNRKAASESMKIKNSVVKNCPHCNLSCNVGNYSRWHGEKCKSLNKYS